MCFIKKESVLLTTYTKIFKFGLWIKFTENNTMDLKYNKQKNLKFAEGNWNKLLK